MRSLWLWQQIPRKSGSFSAHEKVSNFVAAIPEIMCLLVAALPPMMCCSFAFVLDNSRVILTACGVTQVRAQVLRDTSGMFHTIRGPEAMSEWV